MRKITEQAVKALFNDEKFSSGNTVVSVQENGDVFMFLHGNKIVKIENCILSVNFCGWGSTTTKERINSVCADYGANQWFYTKDFVLYDQSDNEVDLNAWIVVEQA